ncbi:MAG: hypothetical protein EOM17_15755 [Synergistales bacterium]|nr:hypothetical protein [Synergistales bacterium]
MEDMTREEVLLRSLQHATEDAFERYGEEFHFVRVMVFGRLAGLLEVLGGENEYYPFPLNMKLEDLPDELKHIEGMQADNSFTESAYWIRDEMEAEQEEEEGVS